MKTATAPMPPALVLTVNAGSSSVRFGLAATDPAGPAPRVLAREHHEQAEATDQQLRAFTAAHPGTLAAIVHRVVHGGPRRFATSPFDAQVEADVTAMTPLAPLHNPGTLTWLRRCRALWPAVPQLAVFDSGFFAELPAVAATYALPAELRARFGLRRLGFHGLAHRSMWRRFAELERGHTGRVISFQLGSGCSVAALRDGRPIDTSMGFSPLEGLVMATRAGDVDPGMLLHLMTEHGLTAAGLADLLNEASGLAGLSGQGGDMRALLASETAEARLAVDVYCYRARKYLGAYMAALGGCDAVLLGGGVAEKAPRIRAGILAELGALGIDLDPQLNATVKGEGRLSREGSTTAAFVVPTDEEAIMAEEASAWLERA
jgi:acetate kinase